uniref:Uncharacterized protein n=1 Tax=Romanomermis culicivorax TaxID=13658 RepID=A0A915IGV0_ROMCU
MHCQSWRIRPMVRNEFWKIFLGIDGTENGRNRFVLDGATWRTANHRGSAPVVAQPLCCKNQYMGEEEQRRPRSGHRSTSKSRPNYVGDHTSSLKRSVLPNGLIKVSIT